MVLMFLNKTIQAEANNINNEEIHLVREVSFLTVHCLGDFPKLSSLTGLSSDPGHLIGGIAPFRRYNPYHWRAHYSVFS
jgi:hypothetical protein